MLDNGGTEQALLGEDIDWLLARLRAVEASKDVLAEHAESALRDAQRLTAEVARLREREADLKRSSDSSHLAASNECARANGAEERERALVEALQEMVESCTHPEFDDLRLDYISVQVSREALAAAKQALDTHTKQ